MGKINLKTRKNINVVSLFISIFICTTLLLIFMVLSSDFIHWFIIPVYLCGITITLDAVNWVRNRMQLFDPIGFLGIFGFHFFFLAPLLQVYWGQGMLGVIPPDDWRPWLGGMGIINLIGLLLYKSSREAFSNVSTRKELKTQWRINHDKLIRISLPLLVFMLLLQIYIYITNGGIMGYISSYTERTGNFEGQGFLFMISESFPIIFLFLIASLIKNKGYKKTLLFVISFLAIYFSIRLFFGGLRGSRSNTIWAMIWAVGIIHIWIRPFTKKLIFLGAALMICFVLVYDIYKKSGNELIQAIRGDGSIGQVTEESGRGLDTVLLGDLARSNIQSFILYRLIEFPESYKLSYGRSYIGDASILIPKAIWQARPPTKVKEGTEILRGDGAYLSEDYTSSRIHGLSGEFMLNFGYIFSPLVFIFLGLYVSKIRSLLINLHTSDSRQLLYPFLLISCFLLLVQDLDNFIFGIVKNLTLPFLLVYLSSERIGTVVEKKVVNSKVS